MNKTILTTALAALIGLGATVDARTPVDFRQKKAAETPFKWAPRHESNTWKTLDAGKASGAAKAIETVTGSDVSWQGADSYYYLETPDGDIWYSATTLRREVLAQEEYYTSYKYVGIDVKIYDGNFNQVGKIDTDITLPEGMEYCSAVEVATCLTRNFFNGDNNYEVMVMFNYKPEGDYGAIPFTRVFSLRGADTPAEEVGSFPGYYIAAVDASTSSWSEDYFMTFFSGETYTEDEMLYTFDVYTKATYQNPQAWVLKSFTVDMMYVMSDGENETLPVMLNAHDGAAYVAVSKYEKTFFEEPFNWFNDALSPDNKYIIELYKSTSGWGTKEMNLESTTEIACEAPADPFTMRSYCLGRFRYGGDITFDFGTGDAPAYILTVNDADMRDNSESYFAVYDEGGNVMETFGHNTDALMLLSDVGGYPQQYCFVQPGSNGNYQFNMVNYPQLDVVASLPVTVEKDGEQYRLSFTLDRVPGDGSYRYAVASINGEENDLGETLHPVLWFDHNGILSRIDRINGGKDVAMMQPYIAADGLTPYLFNTDVKTEYMAFVLRNNNHGNEKSRYNLIVVNEDGELNYCYTFPEDATGINGSLVNLSTDPTLWMTYRISGSDEFYSEFVKLPLNKWEGEGTVENPYIINTAGDFALIKNDLKAHYRLGGDIDFDGATVQPVSGTFTGSLDGAGHTVRNLRIEGAPLFDMTGKVGGDVTTFKDITFSHVTLTDAPAFLAGSTYNTLLENVYLYDLDARISTEIDFGGLVKGARHGSVLRECAVMGNIYAPACSAAGGLVYILFNSKIETSLFEGQITGRSTVGGIAAEIQDAVSTVTDCHVKASLTACHTIGGVAAVSGRGVISDCLVEGEITATEAGRSYSYYTDGWVPEINVGGIVGALNRPVADYETGQTTVGEPVTKNVVALTAINIPEDAALLATAHRIVGRTSVNDDPAIVKETYNPATGDYDIVWGDRMAEEGVTGNYALSTLPVVDPALEAGLNSLEGESVEPEAADVDFFTSLGFKFNGYSAAEPWVFTSSLPSLYFESNVGATIYFDPAAVTITEGEKTYVLLVLERVDFEALSIESSDEAGCMLTPVELDDDGNVVCELACYATGSYTITATNGFVTATLAVTGTSGIKDVAADAASIILYDGSRLTAPGADITVYSVAGVNVASSHGTLRVNTLAPGVYIAAARYASATATLKFVVK